MVRASPHTHQYLWQLFVVVVCLVNMQNELEFVCNMCCFFSDSIESFQNHTIRYHKDDPNFSVACSIGSCSFTSSKWSTFRSHVSRKHDNINQIVDLPLPHPPMLYDRANVVIPFNETVALKNQNALYTLSLQAKHNISESSIDNIVYCTSILLDSQESYIKHKLKEELMARNIATDFIDTINVGHMLQDLDTAQKRYKVYKNSPNLCFVKPEEVVLGIHHIKKGSRLIEKESIAYYIPFQKSVCNMLNLPEVWEHVQNPHISDDEFMYDICDGDYVQGNELFRRNPTALQVVLNTDDLEIVNPLGSHIKKHKLSIFYYQLVNIPPQYRSKLSAIQLVAIGKTAHVRQNNGLNALLKDFISVVNRLSGEGIQMRVGDSFHKIQGALVMVPADTLAANWLGKFKEGVGFAFKTCRMCDITGTDMKDNLLDDKLKMRTDDIHKQRCDSLLLLSKGSRVYWSKMWGINGTSCLLSLTNFSITTGLVQDPMHVLLEGILPTEIGCLMYYFVYTKKCVTLKWFNNQISTFPYSYLHANSKPENTFTKVSLEECTTVKQSSSAVLTLCQIMPLILGPKVPEKDCYWMNFLRLVQIVMLCTSSYCHRETAVILRVLLGIYLSTSKSLYPRSSFVPKKHFAVHFPSQMLLYGPLRHHWCMRFEGKHAFFKGKKLKNFKNLPYTLSKQHQLYMCLKQAGSNGERSSNFLYEGDIVTSGTEFDFAVEYPEFKQEMAILCVTEPLDEWHMYRTKCVVIHGLKYEVGCGIVVAYEDSTPVFCLLKEILIYNKEKFFILEGTQNPSVFNQHILHYILSPTGVFQLKSFNSLKFKWPLSIYRYEGMLVAMNANSHTCEIF